MKKLSVVISAFNSEDKIKDCLESVTFADEIVFIDNSSTDKTVEIAKKYTDKIISQKNDPSRLDLQKNIGFERATGDLILSLDTDERVTPELQSEISEILSLDTVKDGYRIPRRNIIFGKWIEHTGWYPDYQTRLFKKGKAKFREKTVHVGLKVTGEVGSLQNPLVHYNYETVSQFIQKLDMYTSSQADDLIEKRYEIKIQDAVRMPAEEFLKRFFAEKGYLDGLHGLVLSLLMAFYHLVIFAKVWEKKIFIDSEKNILPEFEEAFKKATRDTAFWILKEKKDSTSSSFEKLFLSIQSRFKK